MRLAVLLASGFVVSAVVAVLAFGSGTTDPGPPTGEYFDPGRTATRIDRDYRRRGLEYDVVACRTFDADQQRCEVIEDGHTVARLDVHLNLVTHAIDVRRMP